MNLNNNWKYEVEKRSRGSFDRKYLSWVVIELVDRQYDYKEIFGVITKHDVPMVHDYFHETQSPFLLKDPKFNELLNCRQKKIVAKVKRDVLELYKVNMVSAQHDKTISDLDDNKVLVRKIRQWYLNFDNHLHEKADKLSCDFIKHLTMKFKHDKNKSELLDTYQLLNENVAHLIRRKTKSAFEDATNEILKVDFESNNNLTYGTYIEILNNSKQFLIKNKIRDLNDKRVRLLKSIITNEEGGKNEANLIKDKKTLREMIRIHPSKQHIISQNVLTNFFHHGITCCLEYTHGMYIIGDENGYIKILEDNEKDFIIHYEVRATNNRISAVACDSEGFFLIGDKKGFFVVLFIENSVFVVKKVKLCNSCISTIVRINVGQYIIGDKEGYVYIVRPSQGMNGCTLTKQKVSGKITTCIRYQYDHQYVIASEEGFLTLLDIRNPNSLEKKYDIKVADSIIECIIIKGDKFMIAQKDGILKIIEITSKGYKINNQYDVNELNTTKIDDKNIHFLKHLYDNYYIIGHDKGILNTILIDEYFNSSVLNSQYIVDCCLSTFCYNYGDYYLVSDNVGHLTRIKVENEFSLKLTDSKIISDNKLDFITYNEKGFYVALTVDSCNLLIMVTNDEGKLVKTKSVTLKTADTQKFFDNLLTKLIYDKKGFYIITNRKGFITFKIDDRFEPNIIETHKTDDGDFKHFFKVDDNFYIIGLNEKFCLLEFDQKGFIKSIREKSFEIRFESIINILYDACGFYLILDYYGCIFKSSVDLNDSNLEHVYLDLGFKAHQIQQLKNRYYLITGECDTLYIYFMNENEIQEKKAEEKVTERRIIKVFQAEENVFVVVDVSEIFYIIEIQNLNKIILKYKKKFKNQFIFEDIFKANGYFLINSIDGAINILELKNNIPKNAVIQKKKISNTSITKSLYYISNIFLAIDKQGNLIIICTDKRKNFVESYSKNITQNKLLDIIYIEKNIYMASDNEGFVHKFYITSDLTIELIYSEQVICNPIHILLKQDTKYFIICNYKTTCVLLQKEDENKKLTIRDDIKSNSINKSCAFDARNEVLFMAGSNYCSVYKVDLRKETISRLDLHGDPSRFFSRKKVGNNITHCLLDDRGFYIIVDGNGILTVIEPYIHIKDSKPMIVNSEKITDSSITSCIKNYFGCYVIGDESGVVTLLTIDEDYKINKICSSVIQLNISSICQSYDGYCLITNNDGEISYVNLKNMLKSFKGFNNHTLEQQFTLYYKLDMKHVTETEVFCKIQYYSEWNQFNIFTLNILTNFQNEPRKFSEKKKKSFRLLLSGNIDMIQDTYKKLRVITLMDVTTILWAFKKAGMEKNICDFLNIIESNKLARKNFELMDLFEMLLCIFNGKVNKNKPLNNTVGRKVIITLLNMSLTQINTFQSCNSKTISKGYLNITNQEFKKIVNDFRYEVIEIKCQEFFQNVDLKNPTPILSQFLYSISLYCNSKPELEQDDIFQAVDRLWDIYKPFHLWYLLCTFVLSASTFSITFVLDYSKEATISFCITSFSIAFILMIWEQYQIISWPKRYLNITNIIDFISISMYQINSIVIMLSENKRNTETISVFSITLCCGFQKLYNNLQTIDTFRQLTNALYEIFDKIKAFMIQFVLALIYYSNITYVSRFYNDKQILQSQNYHWLHYVLYSYDYSFGNWDSASPEDTNLQWITLIHCLYSFFFGIIMCNVLITLVSEAFMYASDNEKSIETTLKMKLIIESLEWSMLISKIDNKKRKKNLRLYILENLNQKETKKNEQEVLFNKQTELINKQNKQTEDILLEIKKLNNNSERANKITEANENIVNNELNHNLIEEKNPDIPKIVSGSINPDFMPLSFNQPNMERETGKNQIMTKTIREKQINSIYVRVDDKNSNGNQKIVIQDFFKNMTLKDGNKKSGNFSVKKDTNMKFSSDIPEKKQEKRVPCFYQKLGVRGKSSHAIEQKGGIVKSPTKNKFFIQKNQDTQLSVNSKYVQIYSDFDTENQESFRNMITDSNNCNNDTDDK